MLILSSCSVACSTLHKATHPPIDIAQVADLKGSAPLPPNGPSSRPPAGTAAAAGLPSPFAALHDSEQLRTLFKIYPRLREQLNEIHNATFPPNSDVDMEDNAHQNHHSQPYSQRDGRGRGQGGKEPWSQDRGTQNGIRALCRARDLVGGDGEGVREYSKLVLQIVSGDDKVDATQLIQRELAEENARIISQLLNGEL